MLNILPDLLGYLSASLVATIMIYATVFCIRRGPYDMGPQFILWVAGQWIGLAYVLLAFPVEESIPLLISYGVSSLCLLVLLWFWVCPRR